MHRNWRIDENFDETLVAEDRDCAIVTKGFHSSVACPSSNMYFLNYLAGELVADERTTPPCFHADHLDRRRGQTATKAHGPARGGSMTQIDGLSNPAGRIGVLAIDHRDSLRAVIDPVR